MEVNFVENKLYFEYKTEIEDYFYMAILELDVFFLKVVINNNKNLRLSVSKECCLLRAMLKCLCTL